MPATITNHNFNANKGTSVLGSKNRVYIWLLFALYPFLALIVAFKNYKSVWAKNVLWIFVGFYGFTMVISNESMDANRYREWFLEMSQTDITLLNFRQLIYTEDTNYVDVLQPLVSFIISRFTSNYKFLFLAFALIFGYFYSRNIWILLERAGPKLKKEDILYIITFAFIIGFWQINGFRMWTAAHIFFFGAINYLIEHKKKGFLIASLSVFVHFSFLLPILILLIHRISKRWVHFYFWLFVATFFVYEINLTSVQEIVNNFVPSIFKDRIGNYVSEDYASQIGESSKNLSFHAIYYVKVLRWSIIGLLSIIYFKGLDHLKNNKELLSLFGFTLIFLAISNLLSLIPSGGRYNSVANLFALSFIFFYVQYLPNTKAIKKVLPLIVPALVFFCVVSLRNGFETIGVVTVFGNPLVAVLTDIEIELMHFIK